MFLGSILILLLAEPAGAREVSLRIVEKRTGETTFYSLDLHSRSLTKASTTTGVEVPQSRAYYIRDRQLSERSGRTFGSADDLLYQCRIDGTDVVIVRAEHNSFGSPWRLLSACAGHPIQVSRIIAYVIRDGALSAEGEITRKDSSYNWAAGVLR